MATNPYASPNGKANLGISGNAYGGSNPYLQQNIDRTMGDVSRQYNNTIAPQRAGAAASSGSFGNSGQQAMQLEDQRNFGQTLANTNSQMRMADYTQQQSMYQQDKQHDFNDRSLSQQNVLANRGMDITTQGQDKTYNLGLKQNDTARYGIDTGAASNRYSVDAGERTARMNNATNIRGQDKNYEVGMRQNDTNMFGITSTANTARYGQDKNFELGKLQNETQRYSTDAGTANNRYTTDAGTANTRYTTDAGTASNRYTTDAGTANTRYTTDASERIATAANATTNLGIKNNYELGLRQSDLTSDRLDFDINQGNFDNQYRGAQLGRSVSSDVQNNNEKGVTAGTTMQNAPLSYEDQYREYINRTAGQGGSGSSTGPAQRGDPVTGAIGGMQIGSEAYKQYQRQPGRVVPNYPGAEY